MGAHARIRHHRTQHKPLYISAGPQAAPLPIHVLANRSGKVVELGHLLGTDRMPGSGIQYDPASAMATIWGVNKQMEDPSVCLPLLSLYLLLSHTQSHRKRKGETELS